jgi:hypothetical protein
MRLVGLTLAACLSGAILTGCESEKGHVRPWGMVIRDGTEVLVHARGGTVEGALQVPADGETRRLSVRFHDRGGTEILPGGDFHLEIQADRMELFEWRPEEPGGFDGRIMGVKPGSATLLVRWMHGPLGGSHKDRDWPVALVVTGSE